MNSIKAAQFFWGDSAKQHLPQQEVVAYDEQGNVLRVTPIQMLEFEQIEELGITKRSIYQKCNEYGMFDDMPSLEEWQRMGLVYRAIENDVEKATQELVLPRKLKSGNIHQKDVDPVDGTVFVRYGVNDDELHQILYKVERMYDDNINSIGV